MKHVTSRIPAVSLSLAVAVIAWHIPSANSQILENQQLQNARALVQENQEANIREELRLTDDEEAHFWPLYGEYRADLRPIQDRYVELVADYLTAYRSGAMDNDSAEEMLDEYFNIKSDLLRTRKQYVRKFRRILPMLKVARFYQLETKFFANIDAELALAVPLVEAY